MSELGQTSRASNALLKRQEAIKRWMLSDTNRESLHRPSNKVRITFESETVFLSAVSSGDVEETKNLIKGGVDIDCANVDGLTALHQVRKLCLLPASSQAVLVQLSPVKLVLSNHHFTICKQDMET